MGECASRYVGESDRSCPQKTDELKRVTRIRNARVPLGTLKQLRDWARLLGKKEGVDVAQSSRGRRLLFQSALRRR